MTRALAIELAPSAIRLNTVSPGHIDTPMIASMLGHRQGRRAVIKSYPLRRVGTSADAAALIHFLLSDRASWITGVDYPLDGGRSIAG